MIPTTLWLGSDVTRTEVEGRPSALASSLAPLLDILTLGCSQQKHSSQTVDADRIPGRVFSTLGQWVTKWVSRHVMAVSIALVTELSAACKPRFWPNEAP
jgi:hypothetical protein